MTFPAVIAIDGPVASGKTVVGRLLSRKLGYRFLDTGVMYRAITWVAIERRVTLRDQGSLSRLAQEVTIRVSWEEDERVTADGEDVTDRLRIPRVEKAVSVAAQVPGVREALVAQQREMASGGRMVMVGRDIGTVVLPEAPLKLFLRASTEERARRRYLELQRAGKRTPFRRVLQDLQSRDELDTRRALSPLKPAEDAHLVDTDGMSVEEVVEEIVNLAKRLHACHL